MRWSKSSYLESKEEGAMKADEEEESEVVRLWVTDIVDWSGECVDGNSQIIKMRRSEFMTKQGCAYIAII